MGSLKNKYAIVGVGDTPYTKNSGKTPHALAVEAVRNAILDAGLQYKDIDGVSDYFWLSGDGQVDATFVATSLGIRLNVWYDIRGGGSCAETLIGLAVGAIEAGLCKTMVIYRAFNGASGLRVGAGPAGGVVSPDNGEPTFRLPYGYGPAVQRMAMVARRHMHEYGTTSNQLGAVAVTFRKNACLNPHAMMYGRSMTLEDHQNSRMISDPLRMFDCCPNTDGGCAVVVTSAERAKDLKHRPVYIVGLAGRPAFPSASYGLDMPDLTTSAHVLAAPRVFEMAGVTPQDIDVACLYDPFTILPIVQLEDYGFCKKGEGGPYVEEGYIELGRGRPVVNPNGGQLSEGYLNGLSLTVEAVRQLRDECGDRQVKDAKLALTTGCHVERGASAMILGR